MKVRVIGGGLAGCEAAFALLSQGYQVELFDLKPHAFTPAHKNPLFAELVCSNSLKSNLAPSASWLLKEEMKRMGSVLIPIAETVSVPSGAALAVDRDLFAAAVTKQLRASENLTVVEREYTELDDSVPTVIATGPLTSSTLSSAISDSVGKESLYFFDAAAPIVSADSIDKSETFSGSRYDKGTGGYLNCPLTEEEYQAFYEALIAAKTAPLHDFEGAEVFEGCMPVEVMARRGRDTLRYGMMKSVGLGDCYAAVQLRAENADETSYNLVGFQTNLTIPEQRRVFSLIPALKNAEYYRYGVMHRNTYLDCPKSLDKTMRLKNTRNIYVAGQLSGVEGYVESMASGLVVANYLSQQLTDGAVRLLPRTTMTGALLSAITIGVGNFQPINSNFGLLPPLTVKTKDKNVKYQAYADRALADLNVYTDKVFHKKTDAER